MGDGIATYPAAHNYVLQDLNLNNSYGQHVHPPVLLDELIDVTHMFHEGTLDFSSRTPDNNNKPSDSNTHQGNVSKLNYKRPFLPHQVPKLQLSDIDVDNSSGQH